MNRAIAVLRPEPGNRVTAAALEAAGRTAIRLPLFEAKPVAWTAPDPAAFDALFLTSANAVRHAGPELARLLALPVHAVGQATAEAAQRFGFKVVAVGESGASQLLAQAQAANVRRALHLGGRETMIVAGGIVAQAITVYASETVPIAPADAARLAGSIALAHSSRAARRLREIATNSGGIAIVAISPAAAKAAGEGWEQIVTAPAPSDEAMILAALALAD